MTLTVRELSHSARGDRLVVACALELLPLAGLLMLLAYHDVVSVPLLFASGAGWALRRQWLLAVLFAVGRAALVFVPLILFIRAAGCDSCSGQFGTLLWLWTAALLAQPVLSAVALARFDPQRGRTRAG